LLRFCCGRRRLGKRGENKMSGAKPQVLRADIQRVVQKIVERFNPQKVIVFGSHAYGAPTKDSDVDILVIMETPLRSVEQAVEIRRAVDFPFPVDLLVRTPEQIEYRLEIGDIFLKEVMTAGQILYEANNE
jgi:predicted nucleotidyltransferase